jgi:hypothetical protein
MMATPMAHLHQRAMVLFILRCDQAQYPGHISHGVSGEQSGYASRLGEDFRPT